VRIEILYFDGCPHHQVAEERVREVLEELGVRAEVLHINVKDDAIALKVKFPGSPTIRVDGKDVVPGETGESYSLRCRVYPTSTGFDGAPDKDAIRTAIQRSEA
jgi:hypothetical protein